MKILAVDFGDARTGFAVCDEGEVIASPIEVFASKSFQTVLARARQLSQETGAGQIVVGHPINMDGSFGPRAALCEEFAEKLGEIVPIPVLLWDERSTTVSAIGYLNETNTRGKKRKAVLDAVAATIILDSYLQYRRNHREK